MSKTDMYGHVVAAFHSMHKDFKRTIPGCFIDVDVPEGTFWLMHGQPIKPEDHLPIAKFALTQLPGCPWIVIFHGAEVSAPFRAKGIGTLLHEVRLKAAKLAGFTVALCTVAADNDAEGRIMQAHKWVQRQLFDVTSQHRVGIWTKLL